MTRTEILFARSYFPVWNLWPNSLGGWWESATRNFFSRDFFKTIMVHYKSKNAEPLFRDRLLWKVTSRLGISVLLRISIFIEKKREEGEEKWYPRKAISLSFLGSRLRFGYRHIYFILNLLLCLQFLKTFKLIRLFQMEVSSID